MKVYDDGEYSIDVEVRDNALQGDLWFTVRDRTGWSDRHPAYLYMIRPKRLIMRLLDVVLMQAMDDRRDAEGAIRDCFAAIARRQKQRGLVELSRTIAQTMAAGFVESPQILEQVAGLGKG